VSIASDLDIYDELDEHQKGKTSKNPDGSFARDLPLSGGGSVNSDGKSAKIVKVNNPQGTLSPFAGSTSGGLKLIKIQRVSPPTAEPISDQASEAPKSKLNSRLLVSV
jgi:hypothetical protein